jgi:DNA-binding protein HU-beta
MAKKDKKKKDKKGSGAADPVEAVRSAVERTLKATSEGTSGAQKRGRDLVEEVAQAAAKFRDAMGDLKLLDDLKAEVASLRARVTALEGKSTPTAAPKRTATRSTAAKRTSTRSRSTASRSTATKPAASRAKRSSTTASRSRSSAAKPASTRSTSTRSTKARSTKARSTKARSTRSSSS